MDQPGSFRARRVEVGRTVPIDNGMDDADYASSFEVQVQDVAGRTPEHWARATFEGAPRPLRWSVVTGWRYVLRLRLGPGGSPDHVLGWKIGPSTPEDLILEARSTLIAARKVVQTSQSRLTVTTFVRYERPIGRIVWAIVAPIHHRTEPLLLTLAGSQRRH